MSSSSSWCSSSSGDGNLFFANAVMLAAQMIMEEEEETMSQPRTRQAAINQGREGAHDRLVADYFVDEPLYTTTMFRRQFRMSRRLFLRIVYDFSRSGPFFTLRYDSRGHRGLTTLQKCTVAIHQMAYGTTPDLFDEHLRMSERTARKCLYKFCEWMNCPTAWRGQYTRGDHGHPTIVLEAVASQDLWIWHAFSGVPGSLNDFNAIYQLEIFNDVITGTGPDTSFTVSGVEYRHSYYLADGIPNVLYNL
ncbi:uncharacterized protein LOC110893233 [Helianthus annuus]|uniref:uncharacterized protein LOC110893233 n=1 Tax=Helianthus annuus TaxID=4232 RepID=UPI000B8F4B01|nr:uncharacterized protein LOC110893233 [Helianthus annuus]